MKFIIRVLLVLLVAGMGISSGITQDQTRLVYKIQVASITNEYSTDRMKKDLGLSEDVSMHKIGGRYKYFVGAYGTRNEAQAHLASVPVTGAYVVSIRLSGSTPVTTTQKDPVEVAEETKVVQPESKQDSENVTEMRYRIQVSAEKKFIDPEQIKVKKGLAGVDLDYHFIDGWYKYVFGDYATSEEAEKARIDGDLPGFVVLAPIERGVSDIATGTEDDLERPAEELADTTAATGTGGDNQYRAQAESNDLSRYAQLIRLADDAFTAGELEDSRDLYEKAINIDPDPTYPRSKLLQIKRALEQEKQNNVKDRIKQVSYFVIFFILLLLAVLIYTLIKRGRRKKYEKAREELKDNIQDSVTEYLFDEDAKRPEMIDSITGSKDKQLLIDEIMQLYSNLSGEISNRLRELYIDLGLDNESVRKTESPQWHIRAKGFRELAQMNIKAVNEEIEGCLNSDNDVLRMEAQLAMVRLNYDNPFSFLDKLEKPFTSWEQLHVYEMISRHQINVPDFYKWIASRNDTVVIFSVRMIRAFKQSENYQQLFPLLDNKNQEVREETIITLGELRISETLPVLKTKYLNEEQSGKVLILQAMSNMPEEDNIDFLQSILEPSNALRLEAAEALARIESFGVKGIETILRRTDDDLQAVARHILDSKTR